MNRSPKKSLDWDLFYPTKIYSMLFFFSPWSHRNKRGFMVLRSVVVSAVLGPLSRPIRASFTSYPATDLFFLTSTKGRHKREGGWSHHHRQARAAAFLLYFLCVLCGGSRLLSLSFFLADPLSPFCGSYVPDFFGGLSPSFYKLVPPKRRCCF